MSKIWKWLLVVIFIVGGVFLYFNGMLFNTNVKHDVKADRLQIDTPTVFFHGWGSSYHAEEYMVDGAINEGITSKNAVIRANVNPRGKVTLHGQIKSGSKNPIVEVNFDNSRISSYQTAGRWAKNVIVTLQNNYQFKRINLVGHSMGNLAIAYYLRNYGQEKSLPVLNKQVAIAGHFNGLVMGEKKKTPDRLASNGKPLNHVTKQYRYLEKLRQTYPKSAEVLNIYGDKGNGTDGDLTIESAQSLKYLVQPRAKSYQEQEMKGHQASHSRLHHNDDVNALLYNFLWNHAV